MTRSPRRTSHVHVGAQRIVLDEFAARFDQIAHQLGEDIVGLVDLLDFHLQQRTLVDIEGGFPELVRVHLAETFVALQLDALAPGVRDRLEQTDGAMNDGLGVLPPQQPRTRIGLLQPGGIFIELARIGRSKQRVVDDRDVLDPAYRALEHESLSFSEAAGPAALYFVRQRIEAPCDIFCSGDRLRKIAKNLMAQHAGDRRLLDHLAVITAVQVIERGANGAGVLDQGLQVATRTLFTRCQPEDAILKTGAYQIILERPLVLEILLRLAARDLVERRLGNIEVTTVDQCRHLPEEERQKQGADVGAIDVGVGHQNDLVIAQLRQIEIVAADSGTERRDQRADLLRAQHLVEPRTLDIENLAAQRQHRLEFAIAALLGAAAGGIALDDEQFGFGGIALLAVGQLAGERCDIERALAPRQLARLAGGLAGGGGFHDLADDDLGFRGMLLEPGR